MPLDTTAEAQELLARIRRLESEGQVNEAIALAREGATRLPARYDWANEIVRLENEGKLARPYREGLEALAEGDRDDALRLLSWVAGKNPRYLEVARYLYLAQTGRDPDAPPDPDDLPPPSLLSGGTSPLASPLAWGLALVFGIMGFGLGWTLSPSDAPAPAAPVAEAPATPAPATPEASAPVAATSEAAAPEAAPEAAAPEAAAPAPAAATPASGATASARPASSGTSRARTEGSGGVSEVEDPNLMSEADTLALSCQSGSPSSCFKVGDSYYFGRGIARDLGAAVRYYTRACDLGEARGCYNAADMVEKGESVPKDKNKAKTLFGKGCDLGDTQSCSRKSFLEVETTEVP